MPNDLHEFSDHQKAPLLVVGTYVIRRMARSFLNFENGILKMLTSQSDCFIDIDYFFLQSECKKYV